VGEGVGRAEGDKEGKEGDIKGRNVGTAVVGMEDLVGVGVGRLDKGALEGAEETGAQVGDRGLKLGLLVGCFVGC